MKISSLVKPSAAALAIALCGTPYVAAQDTNTDQNVQNQQSDDAKQSNENQAQTESGDKDANRATCPICGLTVENAKDDAKGVNVVDVKSGSPADKAGVKKGDALVSINDKDVKTSGQMHKLMSKQQKKSEESTVKVGLQRDGAERQVTLTLKSQDEQTSNDAKTKNDGKTGNVKDGKKSNNKKDADKAQKDEDKKAQEDANKQASLGVTLDPAPSQNGNGVRISSVYTNGPAQKAGLKTGDRILKVDGNDVSSVKELQDAIDKMDPDHNAKISVMADGKEKDLDIELVSKAETIKLAMVGNNQPSMQSADQMNADQSLSQTLAEIRNELRELRKRVDAMEKSDHDRVNSKNDSDSDSDNQNK